MILALVCGLWCQVSGSADTVQIMGDMQFCYGTSTTLTASPGFNTYSWSSGQTTQTITVGVSGSYCVTATDNAGTTSEACIEVTERPRLLGEYDGQVFEYCAGDVAYLAIPSSLVYYTIDGVAGTLPGGGAVIVVTYGTHIITAIDSLGCADTATFALVEIPLVTNSVTFEVCENDWWCPWDDCGSGVDTLIGQNGCDSIIIVNVVIHPLIYTSVFLTLCPGGSVFYNGTY